MMKFFQRALVMLETFYAHMLTYRGELLFWALSGSLPLIMMGLWTSAAAQGSFGRTPDEFALYFIAVFVVRQLTVVYVVWEFEYDLVRGRISPFLLQPMDLGWRYFFGHISERVVRLPFVLLMLVPFLFIYRDALSTISPLRLIPFLFTIVLAFIIRFLIQYTFAYLAFFTERASSIEEILFLIYLILSGALAPLDLYPKTVRAIAEWTPFPYGIYYPATLLLNPHIDLARPLTMMVLWCLGLLVINRIIWRYTIRYYSGMGA